MEQEFYILLVAENGERVQQWAIRVDHLLGVLAAGVLCSISIIAPLFLLTR
jgi:hypothetical protein